MAVAPIDHAVARLRHVALTRETRPYLDRSVRQDRCPNCRLLLSHCMCALRPPPQQARAGVCLIMAEFEALKPSNTGWLIADLLADTSAFAWARTVLDPALPALLNDPQWQPYLVFPGEFASAERVRSDLLPVPPLATGTDLCSECVDASRRPLFVLLDGTWAEACKMFRKSPYLDRLPVLSLQPEQLSRYRLRRHIHANHFCTAEVAALCLALAGEAQLAQRLEAYLDVFSTRYLQARQSVPADLTDAAHQQWRALCAK
nr:DTW domain-containing protein [uncultured Roseateles sp.]